MQAGVQFVYQILKVMTSGQIFGKMTSLSMTTLVAQVLHLLQVCGFNLNKIPVFNRY